jgi:hypothetical protein
MVRLEESSWLGHDPRRGKREGQLLGGLRMLFPPQLQKGIGVNAADDLETVDPGVAGAAERDQPGEARATRPAVMDDERGRTKARRSTEPAQPPIAGDDGRAQPGVEAPVMLFARIAGGTQAAAGDLRRAAAAPQGGLPAGKRVLSRDALPCSALFVAGQADPPGKACWSHCSSY